MAEFMGNVDGFPYLGLKQNLKCSFFVSADGRRTCGFCAFQFVNRKSKCMFISRIYIQKPILTIPLSSRIISRIRLVNRYLPIQEGL
ncbi:hypothetical protein GOP47_0009668 [Adiantum capillus-veneris]|uniref:Uncharacterized protein n=1 Tax=Adiantum capillus-veneris TaxID=13818 RepID=A0A9D4ZIX7_ADICA|nr:hypothetical protein GOP47_0009668 [Adiantum capillus-veneris]